MNTHRHNIWVGETPQGSVDLTFRILSGSKPGPTLGIISGVHGHEVSSISGLQLFWSEITQIPQDELSGKIVALPLANKLAFSQKTWGFRMGTSDPDQNLNRQFPGDPKGEMGERIAAATVEFFQRSKPDLIVDLHTMNSRSIPFVIVDRVECSPELQKKLWHYAKNSGLGVIHDLSAIQYAKAGLDGSSTAAFLKLGIPAFTVEVPGLNYANPESEITVRNCLWNIARAVGILGKERYLFWQDPSRMLVGIGTLSRQSGPRAEQSGFFRPLVGAGQWVEKDQTIGEIFEEGLEVIEKVYMPKGGIISNIIEFSSVSTGDELFELMVPEKK